MQCSFCRIVRQVVTETYENDDDFDITYIIIVWVAFVSTIFVPWLTAHWLLIGALSKERFKSWYGRSQSGHQVQRPLRRRSSVRMEAIPVMTCSGVNETVVIHELQQQHHRAPDHPTPGKKSRPKSTSMVRSMTTSHQKEIIFQLDTIVSHSRK